jgi:hypothetical protein
MLGSRVTLTEEETRAGSYAAIPPSAVRGVVVLHEAFGPQPEIERVVDRPIVKCLARAVSATLRGEGPQIDRIRSARTWLCAEAGLMHEPGKGGGHPIKEGKGPSSRSGS